MSAAANIERVAIAGGGGAMGTLFAERLELAGRSVAPLGRPLEGETFEKALNEADLVVLSVPATALEETIARVAPHLRGAILSDVTSVKITPMAQMTRLYDGPVIGTHPLFGPVIPAGFTPRICITPGPGADPAPLLKLFSGMDFSPFLATPEEHDRGVAFVQGLNFISTVAHLAAMRQVPGIERYVTPSFERRLDSARKMLTQDQDLFETISEANPLLQETVRQFTGFLNIAAGGDLELLSERAKWWWRNET